MVSAQLRTMIRRCGPLGAIALLGSAGAMALLGGEPAQRADADTFGRAPGLRTVRSCAGLRSFLRHHAPEPPIAVGMALEDTAASAPAQAPAAPAAGGSPTNVQEAGVDEPD